MSIYINPDSLGKKEVSQIFANVDGQKKEIQSVWANKEGVPTQVWGGGAKINSLLYRSGLWVGSDFKSFIYLINSDNIKEYLCKGRYDLPCRVKDKVYIAGSDGKMTVLNEMLEEIEEFDYTMPEDNITNGVKPLYFVYVKSDGYYLIYNITPYSDKQFRCFYSSNNGEIKHTKIGVEIYNYFTSNNVQYYYNIGNILLDQLTAACVTYTYLLLNGTISKGIAIRDSQALEGSSSYKNNFSYTNIVKKNNEYVVIASTKLSPLPNNYTNSTMACRVVTTEIYKENGINNFYMGDIGYMRSLLNLFFIENKFYFYFSATILYISDDFIKWDEVKLITDIYYENIYNVFKMGNKYYAQGCNNKLLSSIIVSDDLIIWRTFNYTQLEQIVNL